MGLAIKYNGQNHIRDDVDPELVPEFLSERRKSLSAKRLRNVFAAGMLQSRLVDSADVPVDRMAVDMAHRADVYLEVKYGPDETVENPFQADECVEFRFSSTVYGSSKRTGLAKPTPRFRNPCGFHVRGTSSPRRRRRSPAWSGPS